MSKASAVQKAPPMAVSKVDRLGRELDILGSGKEAAEWLCAEFTILPRHLDGSVLTI
ncbi:MAG: hypothetical protein HY055_13225 [Magnetospirillum sp.]|nr:hypothetical protein [Magnetospirillum sp.]